MTGEPEPFDARLTDDTAIDLYITQRRERVDAFVARHFSVPGTIAILRRTFFRDLLKFPINFLLSLPSLVVKNVADWLEMLGWDHLARVLAKLPLPLETELQAAVERLVIDDLLELPQGAARDCLCEPLETYRSSRLTILDGVSSGVALLAAYVLFGDSSVSPYAMGDRLAREQAKRESASGFFLGSHAGSVFYSVFPPHPSLWQVCLATSTVLLGLSALAILTSLLLDPLQQTIGVHKRQLLRLISGFEERLVLHARKSRREAPLAPVLPIDPAPPIAVPAIDAGRRMRRAASNGLQRLRGVLASAAAAYQAIDIRYGRRRTLAAIGGCAAGVLVLAVVIANQMRFNPYRETRELIDAKAYPTAMARLDVLARQNGYQKQGEYWYWRGRALAGEHAYDAAADAYRSAIQRTPAYRDDATLMGDLVDAIASASSSKAKSLLLTESGPRAVPLLVDRAVVAEKIDRWAVVDTAEKLGGANRLDYQAITLTDLQLATTCAEKKRTLQKIGEHHVAAARPALEELDAQPQWRCLQPGLKSMLAELASR